MEAITKPFVVNGFTNLGALLRTANMSVDKLNMLFIDNPSTTVPVYVHFTSSNLSAGLTGTDGIPFSAGAFPARRGLEVIAGGQEFPEVNHIWLFTASSIPVTIAAIGR